MKVLILAAGYATRLYPLTKAYPKSLLKVRNKPIIGHIIEKLESAKAVDEIFIVTNSKFISDFRRWKKRAAGKKPVVLIDDLTKSNASRLGAIGDISYVINKKRIKDDLLVIGGDNLFSGNLTGFLKFAAEKKPAATIGLYKLRNLKDASKYGVVKLDRDDKVVNFEEKPAKPKSKLVAMCLYYIPLQCLRLINDYMKIRKRSDATGNYIGWLKDRVTTYGFIFRGSWYDIGDFKYLTLARKEFAN